MTESGAELFGPWRAIRERLEALPGRVAAAMRQATRENGQEAVGAVRDGLLSSRPGGVELAPLHRFTFAQRQGGGAQPLLDRRALLDAIMFAVSANGFAYRVRINPAARAANGMKVADIADILQRGRVVRVTPQMRVWLHIHGLHLRADTTILVIKPRPFVSPALARLKGAQRARVAARVVQAVVGG